MNYKFNLNFIENEFTVDKEIKLNRNSNLIDKFYFDIFSGLTPRKLIMSFVGFDKTTNFEIYLKNDLVTDEISTRTVFTGFFTVDNRITKTILTTHLIFKILDSENNVIGTSVKIPIKIVNSMIVDDCGGQIGIIDHRDLKGRGYPEQHPAESIIGIKEETVGEDLKELYKKSSETNETIEQNFNTLSESLNENITQINNSITETKDDLTKEINRVEIESTERDIAEINIRTQNDKILNDKIVVENRERQNEDRILGERIDNLTTQTAENIENLNIDLSDKLEQEKRERIAEDLKLENKKINITQIGSAIAPLGKDNLIPRKFLPETLFKSFKYFETIIDRDSSNPIENDWCYVDETKKFYVFIANWKPIELLEVIVNAINIDFDKNNTIFEGSNVQIILQEISNLFTENNLNLENINIDIDKLKEDLKNEIKKRQELENNFEKYKNETNQITNNLTVVTGELENNKLDKIDFETYKSDNNQITNNLTTTIGNLETSLNSKIETKVDKTKLDETLKNYVKEIKIKDDILTTNNSLIDLTDKIKSFVTSVTLELGTTDQIQLILDKLEEHINSQEPHSILKLKIEELQTNLINFKDLLILQIQNDILTHNNSETSHPELFNKLKEEINSIIDDLKTELLDEINQIKLDIIDIQTQIEAINQKFEDLGDVVEGGVTDTDIKISNHNTNETAHPFIQNKITNLTNRVDKLEPKAILTSQNSIIDFIKNDVEAQKIQSGNIIILKNKENKTEIYQFFSTSSIIEPRTAEGFDNPDNYIPLQFEITLNTASKTEIGIVGIGANINIDNQGFIYIDDASTTAKGLVQIGTLTELQAGSTTKVFTGKEIKDYLTSKIPVPATNADVTTGIDNTKFITSATLPVKSVTTSNGLTLNNKVLSLNKEWLTQTEVDGRINAIQKVKNVTNSNGLSLDANGNLNMTKQWFTQSEITTQINSTVLQATTTTAGKIRIATDSEAQTGTDNTTVITPYLLKMLRESGLLGGVKRILDIYITVPADIKGSQDVSYTPPSDFKYTNSTIRIFGDWGLAKDFENRIYPVPILYSFYNDKFIFKPQGFYSTVGQSWGAQMVTNFTNFRVRIEEYFNVQYFSNVSSRSEAENSFSEIIPENITE